MDKNERRALAEWIEALRRKQGGIDAIQRLLANQLAAVEGAMLLDAAAIVAIQRRLPGSGGRRIDCRPAPKTASPSTSRRPTKSVILVADVFGLAEISGVRSRHHALQLCDRLAFLGIKATFAAAIEGYQVTVYGLGAHHLLRLLHMLGIDVVQADSFHPNDVRQEEFAHG